MANSLTRSLLKEEAARRGWQTTTFGPRAKFLKITLPDGRSEILQGSQPQRSSAVGCHISLNKHFTMDYLLSEGYRLPGHAIVADLAAANQFLERHGKIVVKPADGQQSEGVSVAVSTAVALARAFDYARQNSKSGQVIVQQHLEGKLYRLVVIDGTLVVAASRTAARVTGDGQSTVEQLVQQANNDPIRSTDFSSPLKTIDIAAAARLLGYRMQEVLPNGLQLAVSDIDSVSAGGEAVEVTAQVHPDWREFTETVANKLQLFICGFDVICDDISQPLNDGPIPLLELNTRPSFSLHEFPTGGGKPVHLAPLLLNALFD